MIKYFGIFFVFVLTIFLILLFLILISFEKHSFAKFFGKEKKRIQIKNKLLLIASKIEDHADELNEYVLLPHYLSQAKNIIIDNSCEFEELSICAIKNISGENQVITNRFFQECLNAPQLIQELVSELSEVLGEIYSIKHPVKYRYNEIMQMIQKNAKSRILKVLQIINRNKSVPANTAARKKQSELEALCVMNLEEEPQGLLVAG